MPVLKDHYYRLASEQPKERLEAATALVQELTNENEKEDWDYALNRLTKGLITTRQSARFGFSLALTEIIRALITDKCELTIVEYLDLLVNTTGVKLSMKGKEMRSVLFGRLFGLHALINSGVLLSATDIEPHTRFISILVELAGTKSWLRETAMFTCCQYVRLVNDSTLEITDEIKVQVLQAVNDNNLNLSTEGVAIYLVVDDSTLAQNILNPRPNWKSGHPFAKGNTSVLAKALKDVDVVEDIDAEESPKKKLSQKGSWQPRIPFVWDMILEHYNKYQDDEQLEETVKGKKRSKSENKKSKKKQKKIQESSSSSSSDISIGEFWKAAVDETFFSEKSSHERKYWGFDIFNKFCKNLNSKMPVCCLITPNFMRTLINQNAQQNRMLNKIASKTITTIIEVSKSDSEKGFQLLTALVDESKGGRWNFDALSKSKTVDTLLSMKMLSLQLNQVVVLLKSIIEKNKQNENVLKWAADKFLLVVRTHKEQLEDDYRIFDDILNFILRLALFKSIDKTELETGEKLSSIFIEKLNSMLSEFISVQRQGTMSWSFYCCKQIQLFEEQGLELYTELDEELNAVKSETMILLDSFKDLSKLHAKKADQFYCFELLFSMVLVQLYTGDEEAVQVLNELKLCYEDIFVKDPNDEKLVDSSVVLTEVLLLFVSRKSTLLKKFSCIVWEKYLCRGVDSLGKPVLGADSFQLLYNILIARENKQGQKTLFEGGDEFVSENEAGSRSEDDDSNLESSDEEGDDEEEEEENDVEEEEKDDDNDDSANGDQLSKVDLETNKKLAAALGMPTQESGEIKFEDLSSDEGSDYESDSMDDEDMMAMDDQLSKIFKERQDALSSIETGNKRKADVVEAKEQVIFFKNRVLDLLEIFITVNPNSHFNLDMIKPLITLIGLTLDKNLGNKAHKLIKMKLGKCKVDEEDIKLFFTTQEERDLYLDSLVQLVEWIHEQLRSTKSTNQSHLLACNQSSLIVCKTLVRLNPHSLDTIIDIYSETMKIWAKSPKSIGQPSLFFDFINWLNSKRNN
ncbi:DNA-directed DNA polymerase [Scheffersomyces spartinae]|uniref:DNA-directed DNA polymerase n=1 Tax=Scheffersomyces spartinae TaxID=45513 RepID=A0A9P7VDF9_9ASCO|nr:DNA-directed DNA polymerase [Scheffersomyces spartinae]KAG7195804.1 DNA-directed DNA polymerase [Scheffersomyces spartinae]